MLVQTALVDSSGNMLVDNAGIALATLAEAVTPIVRPGIGKNLFIKPIIFNTLPASLPAPVIPGHTKVFINEPGTLFLDISNTDLDQPFSLKFIKPDGSTYATNENNFIGSVFDVEYLIYQSAVGEFDQIGWWQAAIDVSYASLNLSQSSPYLFYIWQQPRRSS